MSMLISQVPVSPHFRDPTVSFPCCGLSAAGLVVRLSEFRSACSLFFSISALESRAVEQFRVHAWVKCFKSSPVSSQHPLPEVTHSISEVLLGQMSIRDQGIKTVKFIKKKKKKFCFNAHRSSPMDNCLSACQHICLSATGPKPHLQFLIEDGSCSFTS